MELTAARSIRIRKPSGEAATWLVTASLLVSGSLIPRPDIGLLITVATGLVSLLPVVALAALLAGTLTVGNWSDRVLAWVDGGTVRAVLLASLAGAVTPVCGLGVLPLIAALLRRGLPLAPVMAFWVSSPIMGPSMAIVTVSIIGVPFAVAKALAAFGTGLMAGIVTALLPGYGGPGYALMRAAELDRHGCAAAASGFWSEAWTSTRLVLRWLALALVLEVFIQRFVPHHWVVSLLGADSTASVPMAALIGAPMYLDGYAALPLVRGLMEMGMSFAAALSLMVSGAAVSLYAAVAVASIVRLRVFVLYVALAIAGACASGFVASWLT